MNSDDSSLKVVLPEASGETQGAVWFSTGQLSLVLRRVCFVTWKSCLARISGVHFPTPAAERAAWP